MVLHRFNDKMNIGMNCTELSLADFTQFETLFYDYFDYIGYSIPCGSFYIWGLLRECNDAFNSFYLFSWIIFISRNALLLISQEQNEFFF